MALRRRGFATFDPENAMKLTTRSRYGTRMLLDLAANDTGGPVRIGEIARRQGISVKYLEKLSRSLKRAGLIKSHRGARGGHVLARPAETISMGEVVRALEGDLSLVSCERAGKPCPRLETCPTSWVWKKASEAFLDRLDSIFLGEMLTWGGSDATEPCPSNTPDEADT